jgi:tape measure domain-containing protein
MLTVGELNAYIGLDDREYNRKVDAAGRRFEGLGNRMGRVGGFIGKALTAAAVGGVAAIGAGLTAAAIAGIKYNSSIQQTTIAMGTMLGSTKKAKELIAEVTELSAKTPFEFPELADATKRLVAYGVSAKEAVPLLTRLGDVSAALNVPIGELSDLYGKAKVQGRLFMEDINQLAGRGIPIYTALAEVMGVGKDEIRGLVEEGKVGFPELEAAFVDMTKKGSIFGGMMEKQSQSFQGLWSTVVDNATQLFGMVMKPAFNWLVKEGLPKAIELVEKFSEGWKKGGFEGGLAAVLGGEKARTIISTLETAKQVVLDIFGAIGKVAGVFIGLPRQIQKVIIAVGLLAAAMRLLRVPVKLPSIGRSAAGGAAAGIGGTATGMGGSAALGAIVPVTIVAIAAGAGYLLGRQLQKLQSTTGGKAPGNTFGWSGAQKAKFDTTQPIAALEKWEKRYARLRAKLEERISAGEFDNAALLRRIDNAQEKVDYFRHVTRLPLAAGHLKNANWMNPMEKAEQKRDYFASLVKDPIVSGHLDVTPITNAIAHATSAYTLMKSYIENTPISSHATVNVTSTGAKPHYGQNGQLLGYWASGGIVNRPQIGVIGESGPEAIIPLTKPRRARELMQQAGLAGAGGYDTVNINVVMPAGTTLVGMARDVGEAIAPHVASAMRRTAARQGRRR